VESEFPIRCFTAANPGFLTLEGTNQYLLGREGITVIDVALPSKENIEGILREMESMGGARIEKILLTHIHRDHSGGALELKRRSGAKLGIHHSRSGYLGGENFTFSAGDKIPYDGGQLVVIHTPGHESGHCCFYEPQHGVLFTGDHILGRGTTLIAPPDGDMALYLGSLEKLLDLRLRLLLPGHGPRVPDPYAKITEYIDHRLMREQQILKCLGEGCHTVHSMAERIYTDIPRALMSAARLSAEAHLIKLRKEGKVIQKGESYYLADG